MDNKDDINISSSIAKPDGEYDCMWSGWQVDFPDGSKALAPTGCEGVNTPAIATITDGKVSAIRVKIPVAMQVASGITLFFMILYSGLFLLCFGVCAGGCLWGVQ